MTVYVFLANGFEEVEAITPIDYLRRCEIEVITVGVTGKTVTGSHGITVTADIELDEINMEDADAIVLPGGMPGTLNLEHSQKVVSAVHIAVHRKIVIGAICAAPSILGHLNHLVGKKVTCAEGFEHELKGGIYTGEPVEVSGNIITSRGAGTANQFAFELVEKLISKERAEKLKGSIRY